jgi:hypothetical protein
MLSFTVSTYLATAIHAVYILWWGRGKDLRARAKQGKGQGTRTKTKKAKVRVRVRVRVRQSVRHRLR